MARRLIVLPDDSARPILAAIEGASRTLRVKMFVFSTGLVKAVIAAKRRGVNVRVMLNPVRRSGVEDNEATHQALARADIEVKAPNPVFDLTHEKSMVVDEAMAFVKSLNWTTRNLTETRDYAVVTPTVPEVRDRICRFINEARHDLMVQNERFQDMVIIECLVRAARRGVKVHVMARPPHTLKHLKLHGKMLVADRGAAIVGSINFADGSLDGRRELAIEVRDHHVVERLRQVAHHDWERSHPLDLSDEGLLADLEGRIKGSAEMLGLE